MLTVVQDELTNEADRKHGYRFGVDGLMNIEEVAKVLGGCTTRTVENRIADGCFRSGKDKGRLVVCRRSLMDYIAGLEK